MKVQFSAPEAIGFKMQGTNKCFLNIFPLQFPLSRPNLSKGVWNTEKIAKIIAFNFFKEVFKGEETKKYCTVINIFLWHTQFLFFLILNLCISYN